MDARELRIGNLISWSGKTNVVEAIFTHADNPTTVMCSPLEAERDLSEFQPIPLTEEWLTKFGYTHTMNGTFTHIKDCDIEPYGSGYVNSINGGEYTNGQEIKYVHQLQNLFFALTGEELTLSERAGTEAPKGT